MLTLLLTICVTTTAGNYETKGNFVETDTLTIKNISVNFPATIYYYDTNEHPKQEIGLRLHKDYKQLKIDEWIVYNLDNNGILHINLKHYTLQEMNEFEPRKIRLYIPDLYYEKTITKYGFTIQKSDLKKNDSGQSTF